MPITDRTVLGTAIAGRANTAIASIATKAIAGILTHINYLF